MATRVMRPSCTKSSPFTIYKDDTSTMSPETETPEPKYTTTMNEAYDADTSISSTSESDRDSEIHRSIESPRDFSTAYTNMSSIPPSLYNDTRKHSAAYTTVSSIPPSLPYNSDVKPYTPKKGPRAAFRSPSSVRAMQMGSPPPFSSPRSGGGGSPRRYDRYESGMTSPLSARRYRPETPSSLRSGSVVRQEYVDRSRTGTPEQATPQRTGPLVLLHITLLPCSSPPYSAKSMMEIAPSYITENWRLLQEKLTDTVLERGLLISHPGEEFDLLEERVLETLDLCLPRITACGHYYGGDSDSDSGNDSGVSDLSGGSREVRAICSTPHEELQEEDVCRQCDQHMRIPGKGIGAGNRKWNVKIFAANGLMKASAWAAACSDMERVDVEIEPWIPEDVKRALDIRLEEEEEEERRQADQVEHLKFELREMERLRLEAEAARLRAEETVKETEALRLEAEIARLQTENYAEEREQLRVEAEAARLQAEECAEAAKLRVEECAKEMEDELKRMSTAHLQTSLEMNEGLIGEDAAQTQASTGVDEGLKTANAVQIQTSPVPSLELPEQRPTTPNPPSTRPKEAVMQSKDIPLSTLLYNYLYLLAQDRRNLVLGFLSILVLFLSYNLVTQKTTPSATPILLTSQETLTSLAQISVSSSSTISIPSSTPLPAAVLQSSAPESQSTAPVPQSSAMTESTSSSTSVYSPPAAPASSHIPRLNPEPEKEEELETSLKAPHSESVSAQQQAFAPPSTATSSTASSTESKQPLFVVAPDSIA